MKRVSGGGMAVEVCGDSVYNIIGLVYPGTGGTETLAGLPDSGRASCGNAHGVGEALAKMNLADLQKQHIRTLEHSKKNTRILAGECRKINGFGFG